MRGSHFKCRKCTREATACTDTTKRKTPSINPKTHTHTHETQVCMCVYIQPDKSPVMPTPTAQVTRKSTNTHKTQSAAEDALQNPSKKSRPAPDSEPNVKTTPTSRWDNLLLHATEHRHEVAQSPNTRRKTRHPGHETLMHTNPNHALTHALTHSHSTLPACLPAHPVRPFFPAAI